MIRVGKSIRELDALADIFYDEVLIKLKLQTGVNNRLFQAKRSNLVAEKEFYNELAKNLKQIIVSRPVDLENLSNRLYPLYMAVQRYRVGKLPISKTNKQKSQVKKEWKKEVLELFNYSFFIAKDTGKWAYEHSRRISLNVCPYCNTQFTFTIRSSRGKTRPQFDHFFNQAKHPYFAMSFYNLIPSCYVCNSNLKGSKIFKTSTCIHPFIEGVEDTLHFKISISKVDFLTGKKNFEIILQEIDGAEPDKVKRAKKNAEVFHIEEQYAFHKNYVGQIIYRSYLYTDSKLNELMNDFNESSGMKLFSSKEEIIEMLYGNYMREDRLHEQVLAKLTKNIANDMGVHF